MSSRNTTARAASGGAGRVWTVRARALTTHIVRAAAMMLAVALAAPPHLRAQADSSWFGTWVLPKQSDFKLQRNDRAAQPAGSAIRSYLVERVYGSMVWLQAAGNGPRGWAPADHVVPVDQAIEFFTNQVRDNPRDAFSYVMRGTIRRDENDFDKAMADYAEAIRIDPRIASAYAGRGCAWWMKAEYDKAIADYTEAIRLDPGDAYSYAGRGVAWAEKAEYDKAIADLNEAIRIDPGNGYAYKSRGLTWSFKKDFDKAITDYTQAIRIDPNYAESHRGLCLERQERPTRLSPTSVRPFDSIHATPVPDRRVDEPKAKKEHDKAVADYSEAIRLDPRDGYSYNGRETCGKPRRNDKAIADFSEAIRLDSRDVASYASRGYAWRSKKEYDKALADFNGRFDSIPGAPTPIRVEAMSGTTNVNTRRPSPTSARPFI